MTDDVMLEWLKWLSGYWTAICHAATLRSWVGNLDWAAIGSMLAGISAAVAAALSLKVSIDTRREAVARERAAVLLVSQEQVRMLSANSLNVTKDWVGFARSGRKLDRRSAAWNTISSEYSDIQRTFMLLSERSRVDRRLLAAKSLAEILSVRSDLGSIWMEAHQAEKSFDALRVRAAYYIEDHSDTDITR